MNRINMIKNHLSDDELKTLSDDVFANCILNEKSDFNIFFKK